MRLAAPPSRASSRLGAPCAGGFAGTTRAVRTRPSAISARASVERENFNAWLDREGAVHVWLDAAATLRCSAPENRRPHKMLPDPQSRRKLNPDATDDIATAERAPVCGR